MAGRAIRWRWSVLITGGNEIRACEITITDLWYHRFTQAKGENEAHEGS
jgi:hypothetical protein